MAQAHEAQTVAEADDRTLVITCLFDAPPDLVFQVWIERAHALNWLDPGTIRSSRSTMIHDFRVGGAWRACLKALDGSRTLWQGGVYREIKTPHRLAYSSAWDGGPETLITVTFAAQRLKTRMIFTQTPFETPERREDHRFGWNSSFDRLQDLVEA